MLRKARYPKELRQKRVFKYSKSNKGVPPTKQLPDSTIEEGNTQFLNPEILLFSKRFHKFYRMKSKQKRKLPLYTCSRIIEEFFKEVRHLLVENEAGVFLEGLGYFCFMKAPERKIHKFVKPNLVFYGKYIYAMGAPYKPIFIPIRKDGGLKSFIMDRGFYKRIARSGTYRVAVKNKKYKMVFTILQNLYGRETQKAIIPNRKEIDNNN